MTLGAVIFSLMLWASPARADAGHAHEKSAAPQARLSPAAEVKAGKEVRGVLSLAQPDGTPLTLDGLQVVHTQPIHLLVIEPRLRDYHHLHPAPTDTPGDYRFAFTPTQSGSYRLWVDITLTDGEHFYLPVDMGHAPKTASPTRKTTLQVQSQGISAQLTLEGAARAGEATLATVTFMRDGKPFTKLEPVMGAFAHMVGFTEDYQGILHVHPMGEEPKDAAQRGGPALSFHLQPEKPGFVPLFVQVRVNGENVFFPFGVMVNN
ncbi:MAG: hypothetical protein K2Q01_00705 [Rickettsiales bacterium]|nr:hypothetical protein [Rickettsiales bacterium]